MSKKQRRSISSFDDVAVDSNINSDKDNDTNKETNTDDKIDNILGKKTKDQTHSFRGYYLENQVADTIDKVTDRKTKGVKSELVNEILKKYFQEEGLL
ncbi:hypothetical protein [Virgibacillus sp. CBA3643]|uniref:hypothetical protein n=1 Tax=Virgibacillus sp. CBA3643 TaxID=2942278 RepID=UPI0035A294F4